MANWWHHRMDYEGVQPDPIYQSVTRQGDMQEGHLSGLIGLCVCVCNVLTVFCSLATLCTSSLHWPQCLMPHMRVRPSLLLTLASVDSPDLPVDGHWRVRFAFYTPAFDHGAVMGSVFPEQSLAPGSPEDAIDVNINGQMQTLVAQRSLAGHKEEVEIIMDGQRMLFSFKFRSSKGVKQLHPFITAGEIALIKDRLPPPAPSGPVGTVYSNIADAVDGKAIKPNKKVSNGYVKGAWKIDSEARFLVFQGSTLVRELEFSGSKLKDELPAGSFSCMAVHSHFYTVFLPDCKILPKPQKTFLGQLSMSPWLNPGNTRIVLNWGAVPKDLDSYLHVPNADPAKGDCLISYKSRVCNSGLLSEVKLDLDATGHSRRGGNPETITFGLVTAGKYVFRVMEYKGKTSDQLLQSGATVSFYSEEMATTFMIGRDGYVAGINWFVFYIDGATKEIKPCDRASCPETLCAAGGWREKSRGEVLC